MAYVHEELTIISGKDVDLSTADFIIVSKKTGYLDLWLNGKHYYYDERIDKSSIDNSVLLIAFEGGTLQKKKKKKRTITITKKSRK